jgi:hypothetical protein
VMGKWSAGTQSLPVRALDLLLGLSAADEVTQSPDDLSRSHHLFSHLDHRFSRLAELFWLVGRKAGAGQRSRNWRPR